MRQIIQPDRAALEIAYSLLPASMSLEDMLKHPALKIVLLNRAIAHMERRAKRDFKKLQSGDCD